VRFQPLIFQGFSCFCPYDVKSVESKYRHNIRYLSEYLHSEKKEGQRGLEHESVDVENCNIWVNGPFKRLCESLRKPVNVTFGWKKP